MARGAEGKLRRRNRKKEEQDIANNIFAESENDEGNLAASDIPLPPGMGGAPIEEDDSDVSEKEEKEEDLLPKKKKKKSKSRSGGATMQPVPVKKSSIKGTPLILLIIMTGSTLLPALIYASDYVGNFFQKHHVLGQLGFRLGMGSVPRKRVLSFYEKHDPTKIDGVPDILSKHYGDYPLLVKKLERKYQDYGYFVGWEEDEAPMTLALDKLQETYDIWIQQYWNRYAPQTLKTAARNVRYNLASLQKKSRKVWKKTLWPMLEPIFGVPKGAAAQKRKDAADARKKKQAGSSGSGRRRNTEFRDDVED